VCARIHITHCLKIKKINKGSSSKNHTKRENEHKLGVCLNVYNWVNSPVYIVQKQ